MSGNNTGDHNALVRAMNLTKRFGDVFALDNVGFEVRRGEWIAIMGPSGSGKTSLINILGGLDTATSGHAIVDGMDVAAMGEAELTRYRAEKVGFVFQQFHLVPYLTALENVMLAQYLHSTTVEAEAVAALQRVGLGERLHHRPAQLSGGEQQRVAVARSLINQPSLILADEPTGNLDDLNERLVLELFQELHADGHTILMVTHNPAIGAMADRTIRLEHGRLAVAPLWSAEEQERVDHLLEQIWVCNEEGTTAEIARIRVPGLADSLRAVQRLASQGFAELLGTQVELTELGRRRARDVVRRHRLAERLFMDMLAVSDREADSQACKFEHIISPELDEKICSFLGHPDACPHGNPIPPGPCCPRR